MVCDLLSSLTTRSWKITDLIHYIHRQSLIWRVLNIRIDRSAQNWVRSDLSMEVELGQDMGDVHAVQRIALGAQSGGSGADLVPLCTNSDVRHENCRHLEGWSSDERHKNIRVVASKLFQSHILAHHSEGCHEQCRFLFACSTCIARQKGWCGLDMTTQWHWFGPLKNECWETPYFSTAVIFWNVAAWRFPTFASSQRLYESSDSRFCSREILVKKLHFQLVFAFAKGWCWIASSQIAHRRSKERCRSVPVSAFASLPSTTMNC